ncbi:MAG: hypothetical protein AUJ07_02730 [Crenarchaeota archaeon 13_1_40CM_3_53_5]|nr:MAG: hypothetical protein AUJ07_02730 [Crenarchaeota archaeon 13_1_40CM_3_53_5]
MKSLGWVFDLYHQNGQMIVWLKKDNGSCVRLVDQWRPRVYIAGETRDLLELACRDEFTRSRLVWKYEQPGDIEKTRALEVEVEGDREALALAERIERNGRYSMFRLYNVDIPPSQMYLYEKNLFPLAYVEVEQCEGKVHWSLKDSREAVDYELPHFKTITVQVKTATDRRIQGFADELKSLRISSEDEALTIDSGSEAEKLAETSKAFQELDPDIVRTEGGDSFIFPYLAGRARKNNVLAKLVLGREPSPLNVYSVQGHSYFSYGKILYRETAVRLPGRLHLDQTNAYISNDCDLEGLFEVSRTCIIPVQRASRATIGTSMTSLQLYNAVKQEVLIPWNKNKAEDWKRDEELIVADRGGFIYEPQTGVHDNIGELDFSSLYPMVMLQQNLSGETVGCSCCRDSAYRVPELGYNICQRWQGIVPRSLEILLAKRAAYKKLKENADPPPAEVYSKRQAALKWILVCS